MNTIEEIKRLLQLQLLPSEGGYYRETYRSLEMIPKNVLPERYPSSRAFSTAIYFLITPDNYSLIHRLKSDEVFHFYLGDPIEILQLFPDTSVKIVILGSEIFKEMQPQVIVPQNVWQGARLRPGGKFALLGTTVAPGFEFADYESGQRDKLISIYPEHRDMIISLTK